MTDYDLTTASWLLETPEGETEVVIAWPEQLTDRASVHEQLVLLAGGH